MNLSESEIEEKPRPVKMLNRGPRFVKNKLQGKRFLIPSCITVVGIFCGLLAVVSAFKGNIEYGVRCVGLAIILDGLDGRVARKLNATSEFGREFDSLSDLLAFGLAPAMLAYSWAFASKADEIGVLIAFIFVVCGATRLARFNVQTEDQPKAHFQGLPIPGAAGAIAALIHCFPEPLKDNYFISFFALFMVLLAYLMVSNLAFLSLKKLKLSAHPQKLLLVLSFFVAFTWYNSRVMLLVIASLYALSGPVIYAYRVFKKRSS